MRNSNDTIGNPTRDIPTSNEVPSTNCATSSVPTGGEVIAIIADVAKYMSYKTA